jgi:hypothetical protein
MLLLVVLLAQVAPASGARPPTSSLGNIAELHKAWEDANAACRTLPHDSPEGEGACSRREVLGSELGRLGWCVRSIGLEIKWEMCPPIFKSSFRVGRINGVNAGFFSAGAGRIQGNQNM